MYNLVVTKNGPKMKESAADAASSVSMQRTATGSQKETFTKANMAGLAGGLGLASAAGRPVIDKTGLTGSYSFTLEWTPDGSPGDASGPSIFTAVEEQLGLKLESSKAPAEFLVVDHAEKPSGN